MDDRPLDAWEALHAHYDSATYQAALGFLTPTDVVLEIGAGDLEFARQMAERVQTVYAVEVNEQVLRQGIEAFLPLPPNVLPQCADARHIDFPAGITAGMLLMRHCTHFDLYFEKLRLAGARRLITNARWHLAVEELDLHAVRASFEAVDPGWYACCCGGIGFKEGPVEQWSDDWNSLIHEVTGCPGCQQS